MELTVKKVGDIKEENKQVIVWLQIIEIMKKLSPTSPYLIFLFKRLIFYGSFVLHPFKKKLFSLYYVQNS